MSSIKRIIKSRPSRPGHVICEVRYPGGRAESVEISDLDYKVHQLKEQFDDAGMNMMVVNEFEKLVRSQGRIETMVEIAKQKEIKKCAKKILSILNFWKSNSQASGA